MDPLEAILGGSIKAIPDNFLIDYRIIIADTADELAQKNMYQRIYFDKFCFKLKILKNAQGGGDDY